MQTGSFDFGSWPPSLSPVQLEALTLYATTYAICHGLLYLPPAERQPTIPNAAIHAPVSLFPSPFPRKLFDLALRLQKIFNVLYARIAMDDEFLDQVMGAETGVGKVDDFIGQLWTGWKQLREEGLVQVCTSFSRTQKNPPNLSKPSPFISASFVLIIFFIHHQMNLYRSSKSSSIQ